MRSEVKSLPEDFLERLRKIIPPAKFDAIANSFSEPKPTTFRINPLKAESSAATKNDLEALGFGLENVPWYSDAFLLRKGRLRELQETEIYKQGGIYIQSLSSMIPPLVLDPRPGELVLDLTAAPGSKTTQMAGMMKSVGKIVAVDNNRIRFYRLKANLELQGAKNVDAMLSYGESIGRKFPNHFDKALLDAPCSSEGRFETNDPKSFGYWRPAKVFEMARKQRKLILSALAALKPGGTLVYSTCTFAPEENEAILDWALKKSEDALEIETISFPLLNQMRGIQKWDDDIFDSAVRNAVRILPNAQMEGFFVAKVRKR